MGLESLLSQEGGKNGVNEILNSSCICKTLLYEIKLKVKHKINLSPAQGRQRLKIVS